VTLASEFDAEVPVTRDGQTVDARSIMGLMMLAAGIGSQIDIKADGAEAAAAVEALAEGTEAFAADRMNRSIRAALAGRSIDEV
jgi:phosphotransferase system HPr (HPr) family protein